MLKTHVLEMLAEAVKMSSEELDHLVREKTEDVVVSLQKENVRIGGEEVVVRRVFARLPASLEYATVGWVVNEDIDRCMTCSKVFWFFNTRLHCHACGNVNCSDCAESFCLVEELPDQTRGVPVCSQCYWGQDVVSAWHRKGVDEDLQAATSRWTDSNLKNSGLYNREVRRSMDIDTESVDSFQQDDGGYNSDSTTDSMVEARLHEEKLRREGEERLELESHEKKSKNERTDKWTKPNLVEDHNRVHFKTQDSMISNIEFVEEDEEEKDMVSPEALFVMKTTRTRSTKKVYINVCTLSDIDIVEEFGCVNGMYVNGNPLESVDKYTGDPITIIDVLVNTVSSSSVCFDKNNISEWMDDVCLEIIDFINTQCYENIEESMPSIPKKKYKGIEVKLVDVAGARLKFQVETEKLRESAAKHAQQLEVKKAEEKLQREKERLEKEEKERDNQNRRLREEEERIHRENEDRLREAERVRVANEARLKEEELARKKLMVLEEEARKAREETDHKEQVRIENEEKMLQEKRRSEELHKAKNETISNDLRVSEEKNEVAISIQSESLSELDQNSSGPTPSPIFVIKTKREKDSCKVFINVCTLGNVDLEKTLLGSHGVVLNGKHPVESLDKSGETCLIFDVLVNTLSSSEVFYDLNDVETWKEEAGSRVISLISTECGESLDSVLKYPKMKGNYKGNAVKPCDSVIALALSKLGDGNTSVVEETVSDLRKQYSDSHKRKSIPQKERVIENFVENEFITNDDLEFLSMQVITPLFVMKSKRLPSSEKVFINVCTLSEVDIVSALAAKRGLLLNGKNPVESADKSGEACFTYDVLVNTLSTSSKYFDVGQIDTWRDDVGLELVGLINAECNESLDTVLKFPKIKGNYKGSTIKPFTASSSDPSPPRPTGKGSKQPEEVVVAHHMKKGWLKKQSRGGFIKNWKTRYFVLHGGEIQYFEEAKETAPYGVNEKGRMDLLGAKVVDKDGLQFCICVNHGAEKDLLLEADDLSSKMDWIDAINDHIEDI